MAEYEDDIPLPSTAEQFLGFIMRNIQGLNKQVQSMETKLDQFMAKFEHTNTIPSHKEGVRLSGHLSSLADNVSMVSQGVVTSIQDHHMKQQKVKSGIIVTI